MQTGSPHRWLMNLFLFRFDGGQVSQRLLVSNSAHTRSRPV